MYHWSSISLQKEVSSTNTVVSYSRLLSEIYYRIPALLYYELFLIIIWMFVLWVGLFHFIMESAISQMSSSSHFNFLFLRLWLIIQSLVLIINLWTGQTHSREITWTLGFLQSFYLDYIIISKKLQIICETNLIFQM